MKNEDKLSLAGWTVIIIIFLVFVFLQLAVWWKGIMLVSKL